MHRLALARNVYDSLFVAQSLHISIDDVSSDVRVTFGKRLRQLRQRRGWTQAEMADILGLDRSYLAEIETGKRNVCLLNLRVIADGLGVTLSRLLSKC
jgi:DNA-binding XRE family transcriptional regulator